MTTKNWTRQELILAFNLYCKIPFGKMHKSNPEIIELSKIINRTSSAVAWKLSNFASLDPSLQARNIKGAQHGSKLDKEIWEEFNGNWENLAYESELLLSQFQGKEMENFLDINISDLPSEGQERERVVKSRVNQNFFRAMILSAYNNTCTITGIDVPGLLIASHIIPWSKDKQNRLNPRNGLCLNALHDQAFDKGLISINENFEIISSSIIKKMSSYDHFFQKYENVKIQLPQKFIPDIEFINYHHQNVFLGE